MDLNCNRANDYRDFIIMAKGFYQNPDGPCAKPINQNTEMCERIRHRTGAMKSAPRSSVTTSLPRNTQWVGNVSRTKLSIQSDADAQRVCPSVCSSVGLGRPTGRWQRRQLQVLTGNQYQGTIGYYDSSCECNSKKP